MKTPNINYKSLNHFSKHFNCTDCYNKRFMKRKGGYIFNITLNDEDVEVVITPLDKNNNPVIYTGDFTHKTVMALKEVSQTKFRIISK